MITRSVPLMKRPHQQFLQFFATRSIPTPIFLQIEVYHGRNRSIEKSGIYLVHIIQIVASGSMFSLTTLHALSFLSYCTNQFTVRYCTSQTQYECCNQMGAIGRASEEEFQKRFDGGVEKAPRTRSIPTRTPDQRVGPQGCLHAPR